MECINLKRDHNMGMEFNAYKFFNTYNIQISTIKSYKTDDR